MSNSLFMVWKTHHMHGSIVFKNISAQLVSKHQSLIYLYMFIYSTTSTHIYLFIYVDNILVISSSRTFLACVMSKLSEASKI